jgi:hypothetical protein
MDWHWSGQMANGIRVYSMSDYQFAMWILPVTFVIAIVMTLFLKESYCKYQD